MTANGDGVSFGVMRMFWNKVIVSQHLNMQKHSELCPFGEFYLLKKFFFFFLRSNKIRPGPAWPFYTGRGMVGAGGATFQRKQELGAFSVREGLRQLGDRESMPGPGGVPPLNPACQPSKEMGWQVGGRPPDGGRDGGALTAGREMTTAQPHPTQRADQVVPAGCSLRAWGRWGLTPAPSTPSKEQASCGLGLHWKQRPSDGTGDCASPPGRECSPKKGQGWVS